MTTPTSEPPAPTPPAPATSGPALPGPAPSAWRVRLDPAYQAAVRYFPWHLRLFVALNLALTVANFVTGRPWWAFWPLLVTGIALAAHYLVYKTAEVDNTWAEERTQDLNLKSYDRGHIEDIKSRFEKGETPPPPPR
jgi:hypothetical protein